MGRVLAIINSIKNIILARVGFPKATRRCFVFADSAWQERYSRR